MRLLKLIGVMRPLCVALLSAFIAILAANEICPIDSYCPTEGDVRECPANTVSPQGSASLADCACLPGYICTYVILAEASI
jgi:hypothetical protein